MVMALIVLALGLTAVLTSWQRVAAHEQERLAALAQDQATWEAQGARNPHSAAHFAKWALRPLTAGALLDPGVSPFAGSAIWMEAHSQNPARARPAEDRADTLLAGEFSTAWILQVLMPLLIAVIAAGAVARERERGTLRLLLASGANAAAILRGKLASVGVIAGLVAGSVLVLGFLASLMAEGAQPLHLLLWAGAYIFYLAIIACVAVAVSARTRTAGQALLVLAGLWLFAIILVPRAVVSAVEVAAPLRHLTASGPRSAQLWKNAPIPLVPMPRPSGRKWPANMALPTSRTCRSISAGSSSRKASDRATLSSTAFTGISTRFICASASCCA
ncbi:ABC transporter permease [Hankyongella ginsenosidimutans]|uniref:ABC transporter permease n=1 Tax=Hankyongella ginsenosidimutans TaxID=1763828 RepID=A0A4D7C839_9SPHN|nr:ABC transporter permease [Hankyongella ginsenosidimutans]